MSSSPIGPPQPPPAGPGQPKQPPPVPAGDSDLDVLSLKNHLRMFLDKSESLETFRMWMAWALRYSHRVGGIFESLLWETFLLFVDYSDKEITAAELSYYLQQLTSEYDPTGATNYFYFPVWVDGGGS